MTDFINLSTLTEYKPVPPGEYCLEITNVIPKKSKDKQIPMLEVHFQVEGGDHDGDVIKQWYMLTTYVNKAGKTDSYAVREIRSMRAAAGKPFKSDYDFPLDEVKAGKELQPLLRKKLDAVVIEKENYKDKTKMDTIVKVRGLFNGGSVTASEEDYA